MGVAGVAAATAAAGRRVATVGGREARAAAWAGPYVGSTRHTWLGVGVGLGVRVRLETGLGIGLGVGLELG